MRSPSEPVYPSVTIEVPGSIANIGPHFDGGGVALDCPKLSVTVSPLETAGAIHIEATSTCATPSGRIRGLSGQLALEHYVRETGTQQGLQLRYDDGCDTHGYPTGGTGLSGAEAVGAIIGAAVLLGHKLSPQAAVAYSAYGEPGQHKDNVAPSVFGNFVFISTHPLSDSTLYQPVVAPGTLRLVMGFSSHPKIGGTEHTRSILQAPVEAGTHVQQVNLSVLGAVALQRGDIDSFIASTLGDEYHEPPRAEAGLYGNFTSDDFRVLKAQLYREQVGLAVSGAGPNMNLWYSSEAYPTALPKELTDYVQAWFAQHGVTIDLRPTGIAHQGAYQNALDAYPGSLV